MSSIDPTLLSLTSQSNTAAPANIPRRRQRRTRPIVVNDLRPLEARPRGPPHNDTTTGAADLQGYSIMKKQRKPRTKSAKTARKSAAPKTPHETSAAPELPHETSAAPELPHETGSDGDSGSGVAPNERVRWRDGVMEWWDHHHRQWKRARYHHDCRAELLQLAAQQPGAPVWTPDMGVDHTSFSYLTQHWTEEDLRSVLDAEGRQVLLMKQRPDDCNAKVKYDPLQLNGHVLLDCDNNPVRDVPGLPLTLDTRIEGWFITGLRRSLKIEMKDIMARLPSHWQTSRDQVREVHHTTYTTRMGRWLQSMGMKDWNQRPQAQARREAKRRSRIKLDNRRNRTIELDADTLTGPSHSSLGYLYGHNPYGQENPYSNPGHIGAGSSPPFTDDAWVTTRETSVIPDASSNQWQLSSVYDDPSPYFLHPPLHQYPPPPSGYYPPSNYPLPPPAFPTDRFEGGDYYNMFPTRPNDDYDNVNDDIFAPEGVGSYWTPNTFDNEMIPPDVPFSGQGNL